ncbi:hypothetical protein [Methanobrevibacter sp.]|uniref:hypothetical protein n=1 Tax=Methanobrevibacter sp. TaxID=66852 RepID=UPI0038657BE7
MSRETFEDDVKNCNLELTHIEEGITDQTLQEIDRRFGQADVLSIENAKSHVRTLRLLALFGTLITLTFLIYDEWEMHLLIVDVILMIVLLIFIYKYADKHEFHKKYVQYRLLAESLRLQYYLSVAGIEKNVSELLPWFVEIGSTYWIKDMLRKLDIKTDVRKDILEYWIEDQYNYHHNANVRLKVKQKREKLITNILIAITVTTYFIALCFELYMTTVPSGELHHNMLQGILHTFQQHTIMLGYEPTDMIRATLKIIVGTMSAGTLFIGSYYGKMSLNDVIKDHRRMEELYYKFEIKAKNNNNVLSKKDILKLAQEYVIENSIWYAYQNKNEPDLTIE